MRKWAIPGGGSASWALHDLYQAYRAYCAEQGAPMPVSPTLVDLDAGEVPAAILDARRKLMDVVITAVHPGRPLGASAWAALDEAALALTRVRRPVDSEDEWRGGDEIRDLKLRALLDAVRDLVEVSDSGPHFRAHALEVLEVAARAWAVDECPICGRRGDHEWNELTDGQRVAHLAEAASQGR